MQAINSYMMKADKDIVYLNWNDEVMPIDEDDEPPLTDRDSGHNTMKWHTRRFIDKEDVWGL